LPKLSPSTATVLDGDVRLVKRKNSRAWQAAFKIDGRWVRVTTMRTAVQKFATEVA